MTAVDIDDCSGTVFLVDDDEGVRKALGRLLSAHGFTVQTFDSAITFLGASPFARPACLVADLRMPGMSGLTLQECLRDADSTLPVIFISGHGEVPDAVSALEGGAIAFIQKPFGEEQLVGAVRRAIALHERREARRSRSAFPRDEVAEVDRRDEEAGGERPPVRDRVVGVRDR
jgi:FixJ family two-component response regulator